MKRGDKEIIAIKSHKALEIILDNLDAQPETNTYTPPVYDVTFTERYQQGIFGAKLEAN